MKKFISISIVCLLIVSKSYACDCALPSNNIEENRKGAHQIFIGEVLRSSSDDLYLANGISYTYYTIQVIEPLKGNFHPKYRLRTFEKISHGSCDYTFEIGKKYLIYASYDNGKLSAHICSRTAPLEEVDEKEIAELKRLSNIYGLENPVVNPTMSMAERELEDARAEINELNNTTDELRNSKKWLIGVSLALALLLLLFIFIGLGRKKDKVQQGS